MVADRWKYFRWTPRTVGITFVYMVAVPAALGYLGWSTQVGTPFGLINMSYDMDGRSLCIDGTGLFDLRFWFEAMLT